MKQFYGETVEMVYQYLQAVADLTPLPTETQGTNYIQTPESGEAWSKPCWNHEVLEKVRHQKKRGIWAPSKISAEMKAVDRQMREDDETTAV